MKLSSIAVTLFALFCIAGGLTGYLKADSSISLLVGAGTGIALLVCARRISRGGRRAALVALVISLVLGVRFTLTYANTLVVMPHLLMVILSGLSILTTGRLLFSSRQAA